MRIGQRPPAADHGEFLQLKKPLQPRVSFNSSNATISRINTQLCQAGRQSKRSFQYEQICGSVSARSSIRWINIKNERIATGINLADICGRACIMMKSTWCWDAVTLSLSSTSNNARIPRHKARKPMICLQPVRVRNRRRNKWQQRENRGKQRKETGAKENTQKHHSRE